MAINFPSTPDDGEEYTDANSGTWVYDSGTNSWTLVAGGSTSAFNFRGGHDFRSSTPPASPIQSGDMWIHDAPDGTIDGVYTGISGQIANGQLVLWDGNSYVMVSGTLPGYPDVGDGEGGTLDSRYLKLGTNAGDQTVASTGTIMFNGAVVSNSTFQSSGNIRSTGGYLEGSSSGAFKVRATGELQGSEAGAAISSDITTADNDGPKDGAWTRIISSQGSGDLHAFHAYQLASTQNNYDGHIRGFFCNGNSTQNSRNRLAAGRRIVAFEGRFGTLRQNGSGGTEPLVDANGNPNVYNFLAQANAPNFFQGNTYIGGTFTRNTRELWESTLSEEQKEQLKAGTLAIPANVSTPGDGSFVRQWWYNQQSAEDQALIDAGELDYPERYQAANFVDAFALGTDTNIDLMGTGAANFAGNVDAASFTVNGTPLSATVESLQTLVATLQTRIEALEAAGNGGY